MYKVLLVDDESIIRKGLRNTIPWQDYNCIVCGEASDGYEGLEMIESLEPDIVFADIRMPVMDGLEMIGQIADSDTKPKIVILTGYSDFEYAREALVLGVSSFLLKPTKLDEIRNTIESVVTKLDDERAQSNSISSIEDRYYRALPRLQRKLLHDTMLGISDKGEKIRTEAGELGMDIDRYYLMIASIHSSETDKGIYEIGHIQTFVDLVSEEYTVYDVAIDLNSYGIIINIPQKDTVGIVRNKLRVMQSSMQRNLGIVIHLALSDSIVSIDEIGNSYYECMGVLEHGSMVTDDGFATYSDITRGALQGGSIASNIGRLIIDTISYGSINSTRRLLETVFENNQVETDDNVDKLKDIAYEISEMLPDSEYIVEHGETAEDFVADIRILALEATGYIHRQSDENTKQIVKKAIEYLEENYHRHVTLSQVAEQVYVSSYYISRIFRKETGMTMTEYLNDVRIRQACTMLENVKLKVYQVGQMVGISDAHYFSRLFKTIVGVTPSEYRNSIE